MSKSIKLKDNNFIDSSGIVHNKQKLNEIIFVPVILYENSTGSNEDITLSDSAENYEYIDILYRNEAYHYACARIYHPNGAKANLISMTQNNSGTYKGVYYRNKTVLISGNSISIVSSSQIWVTGDNQCGMNIDAPALTYITRVIGYK